VYDKEEADRLKEEKGWVFKLDGNKWRRVVPSPLPKRIFEIRLVKWLLEKGTVVICPGGGIPTMYEHDRERWLSGIKAVIDKDLASELLAREVEADLLVIATDVNGVFLYGDGATSGPTQVALILCTMIAGLIGLKTCPSGR
jgi:carbamate kinase